MPEHFVDPLVRHRCKAEFQPFPNSFEAIRKEYGVAIEADIFLLRDGTIAVVHNKDVGMSDTEVEELTTDEISELKAGGREEAGAVPLFREYVFNSFDRGIGINVEIKASTPEKAQAAVRAVVDEIEKMKTEGLFAAKQDYPELSLSLHSFSVEALQAARNEMNLKQLSLKLGLLWPSSPERAQDMAISATSFQQSRGRGLDSMPWPDQAIEIAAQVGIDFVDIHASNINAEVIEKAHSRHLKVYAWVVTDAEQARRLLKMGVDKIIYEPRTLL